MKIDVICEWCGKMVEKEKGEVNRSRRLGRRLFCNNVCGAHYGNKGVTIPMVDKICPVCKRTFKSKESGKRAKVCCGPPCSKRNGRKQSPETREKISATLSATHQRMMDEDEDYLEKMMQNLNAGNKTRFNSKGELELKDFLQASMPEHHWSSGGHLKYGEYHIARNMYSNELKVCVEYDGIWHFKDIHGQLEQKQAKDRALEDWCIEKGYRIIRIDEDLYKRDEEYWKGRILDEVLNGKAPITFFYSSNDLIGRAGHTSQVASA